MWQCLCTSSVLEIVHDLNKEGSHDEKTFAWPFKQYDYNEPWTVDQETSRIAYSLRCAQGSSASCKNRLAEHTIGIHAVIARSLGAVNRMHLEVLHP